MRHPFSAKSNHRGVLVNIFVARYLGQLINNTASTDAVRVFGNGTPSKLAVTRFNSYGIY